MTFLSLLNSVETTQVWLEFEESEAAQAWQQTERFSTPNSRWNAYLNRLCVNILLPWLREEYAPSASIPNNATLASFWEINNGTSINCDIGRLVIIPSEAVDLSEMRVPQEWVDINSWAGDYYVAVQVEPEDGWLRVWGYATHARLKELASYDANERVYSLNQEDLFADINLLWMARQLCPEEITRAEIAPLPTLSLEQTENLLTRLGNPEIMVPRLAVPFTTWAGLLEHSGWQQRLYERRQGMPEQWSVLDWMQRGVSDLAQNFGWGRMELQPSFVGARGSEPGQSLAVPVLVREVTVANAKYELRVLLKDSDTNIWRFELQNVIAGELIPAGIKLRLLTEDLQPFENNEDFSTVDIQQLYIEVALGQGEGLIWEIEPTPEGYSREILRF